MPHLSMEEYVRLVTILATWITVAAAWLAAMMLARMLVLRQIQPPDIATFLYVASTVVVFAIIALRYGDMAPMWLVVLTLAGKAVACTGVAVWAWRRMRKELL
jgi:hypothetical protein